MAVIAEVAFGLNVDSLNNPNEPFLVNAQKLFENLTPSKRPFILKIAGKKAQHMCVIDKYQNVK